MTKNFFCMLFLALTSFTALAQVPNGALIFETNLEVQNGSVAQIEKLRTAEDLMKKVIASDAFRNAVLGHTYNGTKTYVDNGGLTNLQIYNRLVDGAETLNKVINNKMDMQVEFYYNRWTSTVGYTYPDITKIYVNTKFFNSYSAAEVTQNLIHEWLHKLGFTHASSYSTSRDYSVPYAIGTIMGKLAALEVSSPSIALTPATNLAITQSGTTLSLAWNAAKSSAGIKEYKIYRKLSSSTTFYLQGTITGLTYSQPAPSSSAVYYVKAVDGSGKTVNSSEVSFTRAALSAVSNLTLTKLTTTVSLKWGAATSPAGIKEYKIYRRLDGSSTVYLQGTTTQLSFVQNKPSVSATYYVRAVEMNSGLTAKSIEVRYTR